MERFLISIEQRVQKDLNEFVKWIILLGIYVFYRMMAAVYDETNLYIIIIPLVFIGFNLLIINWTIGHEINFLRIISHKKEKLAYPKSLISIIVCLLCFASILFFILYFINLNLLWIDLGMISMLTLGILAMEFPAESKTRKNIALSTFGIGLIIFWIGLMLYNLENSIVYFNELNFLFYLLFLLYYFLYFRLKK